MTLAVRAVPYGTDAARALRDEIGHAKQGDPLYPVTVLVPRGAVGLAARRLLASGDLGPPGGGPTTGVVNVQMVPPARLAEQLVGSRLAESGRIPMTAAVLAAAVRTVLAGSTGPTFGPLQDHPATVRALVADYHEVSGMTDEATDRLARQSVRVAEVVRAVGEVRAKVAGWYDDGDLLDGAARIVEEEGVPDRCRLGSVVVYLAELLPVRAAPLVQALGRRLPLTVLAGMTGDEEIDADTDDLIEWIAGRPTGGPRRSPAGPPTGTSVVSAPSADTEVLIATRTLVTHRAEGMPFDRMAVVHAGAGPYPRLIRDSLAIAGIPFNGSGVRSLRSTVAGRVLSGYFDLLDANWPREGMIDWLAASPILDGRARTPVTRWDQVSRRAGVGTGLEDWRRKLAAVGTLEADGTGTAARRLADFVGRLAGRLDRRPMTWTGWETWSRRLLHDYLGGPRDRLRWPAEEEQALIETEGLLRRLGDLDRVDPQPDLSRFRAALSAEMDDPAPQVTRFGRGVQVGTIADLVGLHVDLVLILGLHEGACTSATGEDTLLRDHERAAAGMAVRAARSAFGTRRQYLAALSAGTTRVLSFARGDQRGGGEQRPSRWLLDTVEALGDRDERLVGRDLAMGGDRPGVRLVPSHVSAVAHDGRPASEEDHQLRGLLEHRTRSGSLDGHPSLASDPVLARGVAAHRARAGHGFTRFDGHVDPQWVATPADGVPQSPTSLETYATCPRRYFLSRVLGLRRDDRPEDTVRLRPVDKGTMVHTILERFVTEELARPPEERIEPSTPWWTHGGKERLERIADEELASAEAAGVTGKPLLWRLDRAAVLRELAAFLGADDEHRARERLTPEAVEVPFGFEAPAGSSKAAGAGDADRAADHAPVGGAEEIAAPGIELSAGRVVRFRGVVDRVDRAPDGSTVVIDYKTGSSRGAERLIGDPVDRGRRLQLAVYGLAAREHFGEVPIRSAYWFVSERGRFEQRGYGLDQTVRRRLEEVVGVLVSGIDGGNFPARPGEPTNGVFENCRFCDFQAVCPADRGPSWARKRGDHDLAPYVQLAEGPDVADPGPDVAVDGGPDVADPWRDVAVDGGPDVAQPAHGGREALRGMAVLTPR